MHTAWSRDNVRVLNLSWTRRRLVQALVHVLVVLPSPCGEYGSHIYYISLYTSVESRSNTALL